MSELRKDPVVDRWVIITDDASRAPGQLEKKARPQASGDLCPFCPGNEHLCPPDILTNKNSADGNHWSLRVIPNRSPILMVEEELKRSGEGLYDKISGVGANEVIIETSRHAVRQSQMELHELENIFWAYRDRILDLKKDSRIRYVLVYKNQGQSAGATVEDHQYSIIMALPIVPRVIMEELEGARKHFEYKDRCIYCDIIQQELSQESRIVAETRHFVAIQPFAPRMAFETWIIPKRHSARFVEIEPTEIHEAAILMKEVLAKLDLALSDPDYNYVIHAAPFGEDCEKYYHWHIEILPRMSRFTGFELGSDLFINATPPEEAARFLKTISI